MSRVLDEIVTSSGSDDEYINTSGEDEVDRDDEAHDDEMRADAGTDHEENEGEGLIHQNNDIYGGDRNERQLFVGSDDSEEVENVSPWQFQRVIRKEINGRLPSNYNLKRWRKPSRVMIDSVMQLLESNGADAIDTVFQKYEKELFKHIRGPTHVRHQEMEEIKREKEKMVRDILLRIEKKLRFSKFPSRLSENDFNVEYIYEKRRFLQERYAQELQKAELLEKEITRENKLLQEARQLTENLRGNNDKRLREKLERNDIHPSMLQAISEGLEHNSFGNVAFNRDKIELNLELYNESHGHGHGHSHKTVVEEQLPSLKELNEAIRNTQNRTNVLLDQTHIDTLNDILL
ncbi:Inner kinetochore subunit OKP1 [Nakaseomyces bracarensis]|uniref:Inner kinetochore subunit OKP1 n=1 Tax=Nakaseomyces bracarensis TaxID=273131 RepID=A0ABR4NTQ8_9SACH